MDIKEIALKVADSLRNKVDGISHMQSNQGLVRFTEALISAYKAELLKEVGEPVAYYDPDLDCGSAGISFDPLSDGINLYTSNQVAAAILKATKPLEDQLAKGNEPCAFLHEWIEYHPFGDTVAGEPFATITNDEKPFDSSDTVSPLFTFPPTAEQIANETAEAIAKMLESGSFLSTESKVALAANGAAKAIRRGAWKGFKK